ncbi:hypothetical protein BC941DRAFT_456932 [Chlamydoabsidia padenii]|nr:hypothetical protein BC941DRAFT_456932 [Chlamydoabsidia padenii]
MVMGSSDTGDFKNVLQNSTVMYSVAQDRWTTLPSLPNTSLDNKTRILDGFYDDKVNVTNVTLPTMLYGLNTKTWQWTSMALPNQYNVRADHAAALSGNKMYISGGMTLGTNSRIYLPMDQILVFDTTTQQWQQITTQGPTPSLRRAFTMTYLPHKDQFVVYGGIYDTGSRNARQPLLDICYTLTVTVLYGTDLFIMFGVDETEDYREDVNILDTLTWQWKSSYGVPPTIWTTPAIVGLVFGLMVGILLIICGVYHWKKCAGHPQTVNDTFIIDSTDDPRLRMDSSQPIYQEQSTRPKQVIERHLSGGTTVMGSEEGKDSVGELPRRNTVSDSIFTSFSATTATKPDLSDDHPFTPVERIKPEGDH